ncbi:MAG: MBL fold metallo-hydrolase [Aeromicrobium sp.]
MKLTIVGCSGSYPGPDSAASCYLVEEPYDGGIYRLVLDMGNGALGALQRYVDLRDVNAAAISHLHADHSFDLSVYYVVSRYHPDGSMPTLPLFAPAGADRFLSRSYGPEPDPGILQHFDYCDLSDGLKVELGPFTVTFAAVDHPVEAYAMRLEAGGKTLVYSGDSGPFEALDRIAEGADVFLCEASFVESKVNPPHLHLTGAEAGEIATKAKVGRLLITHIPAWTDRAEVERDTKSAWDGQLDLVNAGDVFEI